MSTLFIFTCYNTNCLIFGKFRPAAAAETYAESALIGPLKIPYKGFTRLYLEVYFYVHERIVFYYVSGYRQDISDWICQTGNEKAALGAQFYCSICTRLYRYYFYLSLFFSLFFLYTYIYLSLILFYFLTISELRCRWILLIQTLNPFANNSTSYIENELKEPIARPMS